MLRDDDLEVLLKLGLFMGLGSCTASVEQRLVKLSEPDQKRERVMVIH